MSETAPPPAPPADPRPRVSDRLTRGRKAVASARPGLVLPLVALAVVVLALGARALAHREARLLRPAPAAVTSLALSDDGRWLAVGWADGTLEIRRTAGASWSAALTAESGPPLWSGFRRGLGHLDLGWLNGRLVVRAGDARRLSAQAGPVAWIGFRRGTRGLEVVYAHAGGRPLAEPVDGGRPAEPVFPESRTPVRLDRGPDGSIIAIGQTVDGSWRVWRLPNGAAAEAEVLSFYSHVAPDAVGLTPHGLAAKLADDTFVFEDGSGGGMEAGPARVVDGEVLESGGRSILSRAGAFDSPTARIYGVVSSGRTATGRLAYCDDGRYALVIYPSEASVSIDRIELNDGATERFDYPGVTLEARPLGRIACDAQALRFAYLTSLDTLHLFDPRAGERIIRRRGPITGFAFDPEGRLVVACCGERLPAGLPAIQPPAGELGGLNAAEILSRDGRAEALGSPGGGFTISTVNSPTGGTFLPGAPVAFSPRGDVVAATYGSGLFLISADDCLDGVIAARREAGSLWTIDRRGLICRHGPQPLRLRNPVEDEDVATAAFVGAGSGARALVGYRSGAILAISLSTGQLVGRYPTLGAAVTRIAKTAGGRMAAVGGADGGVELIDLGAGDLVARARLALSGLHDRLRDSVRRLAPLPLDRAAVPALVADQPNRLRGRTVLWLDGGPADGAVLADELRLLGVEVLQARSTAEALRLLGARRIDLAVAADDAFLQRLAQERSGVPAIRYAGAPPAGAVPPGVALATADGERAYDLALRMLSGGELVPPVTDDFSALRQPRAPAPPPAKPAVPAAKLRPRAQPRPARRAPPPSPFIQAPVIPLAPRLEPPQMEAGKADNAPVQQQEQRPQQQQQQQQQQNGPEKLRAPDRAPPAS